MDPHDFGLLDPHLESKFQRQILNVAVDLDPDIQKLEPKFELLCDQKFKIFKHWFTLKVSYTITWLAIAHNGHEYASASRFFPGSESASALFFLLQIPNTGSQLH